MAEANGGASDALSTAAYKPDPQWRPCCRPGDTKPCARPDMYCYEHGPKADPEPEIGSPAWRLRRRVLWDQHARDLMASLVKYEDEHPDDAICLAPALEAARRAVPRA